MSPREAIIPSMEGSPEQLARALLRSPGPPYPAGWTTPVADIAGDAYTRLDAEHYDPDAKSALESLVGFMLAPLYEWADIDLPGPFTRIWADDAVHGLPYVNATDLMNYAATGTLEKVRFLSRASKVDINRLILAEGTLLVTCSGTLGRVYVVPPPMTGWAGTPDLVRVKPHDPELTGFLLAYLRSTYAQAQLLADGYGGQIDRLTDKHVGACLVPKMGRDFMLRITREVNAGERSRYNGVNRIRQAIEQIETKR